jgi:hypothetical protein
MARSIIAALAIAGLLTVAQTLLARQKKEKPSLSMFVYVKSLSAPTRTITISKRVKTGEWIDETYKVAKDCKITINGERKLLSDVKEDIFVILTISDAAATEITLRTRKIDEKR